MISNYYVPAHFNQARNQLGHQVGRRAFWEGSIFFIYGIYLWYIWKICYIFVIFLAEGLVEILNQCIVILQGGNRENIVW